MTPRPVAAAADRPALAKATSPGAATILVRYVLFAVVATVANLATQAVVFRLAPVAAVPVSIAAGTIAGFVAKYILDKKWVFYDDYTSHSQELRKVTLYGAFSVVTTLVFWGFEVTFWTIWQTELARYAGAVLGLAIGYAAKFGLDRRFVFTERRA